MIHELNYLQVNIHSKEPSIYDKCTDYGYDNMVHRYKFRTNYKVKDGHGRQRATFRSSLN